jgi:hypothetical protein
MSATFSASAVRISLPKFSLGKASGKGEKKPLLKGGSRADF